MGALKKTVSFRHNMADTGMNTQWLWVLTGPAQIKNQMKSHKGNVNLTQIPTLTKKLFLTSNL